MSDSMLKFDRIPDGYINEGSYGDVNRESIMLYGIQKLHATKHTFIQKIDEYNVFIKEIMFLMQCNHKNIVKMSGYYLDYDDNRDVSNGYIFMELCHEENLLNYMRKMKFDDLDRIKLAIQICEGMVYLHEKVGIVHGDLKMGNILIGRNGEAKICDFGTCRRMSGEYDSFGGTIQYMPPEVLGPNASDELKRTFDIYSFGILLWEIFSNKRAYEDIQVGNRLETLAYILRNKLRPKISLVKTKIEQIEDLIVYCWQEDTSNRPSSFVEIKRYLETTLEKAKKNRRIEKRRKLRIERRKRKAEMVKDVPETINNRRSKSEGNVSLIEKIDNECDNKVNIVLPSEIEFVKNEKTDECNYKEEIIQNSDRVHEMIWREKLGLPIKRMKLKIKCPNFIKLLMKKINI